MAELELRNISLQGFRRFEDKVNLQLNGKLVSLVGPNEAGKTSVLKALQCFSDNEAIATSDVTYQYDGETKLVLSFFLNNEDLSIANLSKPSWFFVYKSIDGDFTYRVDPKPPRDTTLRKECSVKISKIIKNNQTIKQFNNLDSTVSKKQLEEAFEILTHGQAELSEDNMASLSTLEEALENIDNDDTPTIIEDFIESLQKLISFENEHDPHQDAINKLCERVPNILLFGEEDRNLEIPYNVSLHNHKDTNSRAYPSKPLQRLIDIAQLDLLALWDAHSSGNKAIKTGIIDEANDQLKKACSNIWSQSDAFLKFHFESGQLDILVVHNTGFDLRHRNNNFADRSDGYKQFIALQVFTFLEEADNAILLIDEIEQHLHYNAQADLIHLLSRDQNIAKVIYTTHSAGCLPEDLGNGVRLIQWHPKEKRKSQIINRFWHAGDGTGFSPLLFGMGASSLSFFPMRHALLGEGATELLLLPRLFREALQVTHLDFQIVHGLSNINPKGIPTIDDMTTNTAFILDNDEAGKTVIGQLSKAGVHKDRIFSIGNSKTVTIEDVLCPKIWLEAVNQYIDQYGSKIGVSKKITAVPTYNRIKNLPDILQKKNAKINIAYNILDIIEKGPNRNILWSRQKIAMKKIGENIQALFAESKNT